MGDRQAYPFPRVDSGEAMNLFLELLSKRDAESVLRDLYSGKPVALPSHQNFAPKVVSTKSEDPSTRIDPLQTELTAFPPHTKGNPHPKFKYEEGKYVPVANGASCAAVASKFASMLKGKLRQALESGKPVVFLGGECSDGNEWREKITKEFGGKLALIDPYDKDWEAEDNIYDELSAILQADHVVFYKGGKGTDREKEFLKDVGDPEDFKSFEDLGALRTYLDNLSKPVTSKTAKKDGVYDHAIAEVMLPKDIGDEIIAWGKKVIPDEVIVDDESHSEGREDEIHVTVLYGFEDGDADKVREVVTSFSPFEVRLGLVTLFKDKKEHDVIKIDVESSDIHKIHDVLKSACEVDSGYPTYVPHVTVAYVKKGAGDMVLGSEEFRGKTFKVSEILFKSSDKQVVKIPMKGKS